MLLSVLRSCSSVRTASRNFRLNSYLSSTVGVTKRKQNVWFLNVQDMFRNKTVEEVESLKIVPEGYKVIYLSKELKSVTVARIMVFVFFGVAVALAVVNYVDPDSISMRKDIFTVNQTISFFLIQTVVMYAVATRHVYYIFRKQNSYKTVYYGLFGKWQPRIVSHEAKELTPPNKEAIFPFFHHLKGKPLIINSSGFFNMMEYSVLVKSNEPHNSNKFY